MSLESLRLNRVDNWLLSRPNYDNRAFFDRPLLQASALARHPVMNSKRCCVAGSQPAQYSWQDFDPARKDVTDPVVIASIRSNSWDFVNGHRATKWDAEPGMSPDCKQRHAVPPYELRSFTFSADLAPWWAGHPAQPANVPIAVANEATGVRRFTKVIGPVEEVLHPAIEAEWNDNLRPSTQTWDWYLTSPMRLEAGSAQRAPSADQA